MLTYNEISLWLYQSQGELRSWDEGWHVVLEMPDGTQGRARHSEWMEAQRLWLWEDQEGYGELKMLDNL